MRGGGIVAAAELQASVRDVRPLSADKWRGLSVHYASERKRPGLSLPGIGDELREQKQIMPQQVDVAK